MSILKQNQSIQCVVCNCLLTTNITFCNSVQKNKPYNELRCHKVVCENCEFCQYCKCEIDRRKKLTKSYDDNYPGLNKDNGVRNVLIKELKNEFGVHY